jgi:hypothetical protein
MPNIDPTYRFIIQIVGFVAIAVSQGTLSLTHAIPADYIPIVTAWCGIIAVVISAVTTGISGLGMSTQSRIASAAAVSDVKAIVTTSAVADAAPSNKVVAGEPPH